MKNFTYKLIQNGFIIACAISACLSSHSLSNRRHEYHLRILNQSYLTCQWHQALCCSRKKDLEAFVRAENELYSSVHHHITLSGTQKSQLKQPHDINRRRGFECEKKFCHKKPKALKFVGRLWLRKIEIWDIKLGAFKASNLFQANPFLLIVGILFISFLLRRIKWNFKFLYF